MSLKSLKLARLTAALVRYCETRDPNALNLYIYRDVKLRAHVRNVGEARRFLSLINTSHEADEPDELVNLKELA